MRYAANQQTRSTLELVPADATARNDAAELVRAERLRLARELHDIVSYGFATVAVHAGIAAHVAESRPEQAVDALRAIRTASRDVLDDVRAVLGQLREDDDVFEPARGVGSLEPLAQRTSDAGVPTSLRVSGQPRPVPVVVDQTVYRIVQEALANVIRHSPGAAATVSVVYEARSLVVTVENGGNGAATSPSTRGSGYGLVGMRERALALGGDLEAGPKPGGGFRVIAVLPFLPRP
jgi:signal transduction histidine kinase